MFIMLKGFLNTLNISKMCKNINNTHKEALNSPEFVGLLTVQSEVLRVLMALVVPKSKNFHLDLTSRLYP